MTNLKHGLTSQRRASPSFALEDHMCKACGGRILRQLTGSGPTPGGNPVYICADCGRGSTAMGPDVLCWCGYRFKNQSLFGYNCLPTSLVKSLMEEGQVEQSEALEREFKSCGIDPRNTLIGIVTGDGYQRVLDKRKDIPGKEQTKKSPD